MILILIIYLLTISIMDIMRKSIPIGMLMLGGAIAIIGGLLRFYRGNESGMLLFVGLCPGVLFLLISFLTHTVGAADGIVISIIGLIVGLRKCLVVVGVSIFLVAMFSVVLLVGKKVTKNTGIPYIPFIFLTFLITGVKI